MRRILVQLISEPLILRDVLLDSTAKFFVLRFKLFGLGLKFRYLALERGILIRRQAKAFAKNRCGAMLINEFLDRGNRVEGHVFSVREATSNSESG